MAPSFKGIFSHRSRDSEDSHQTWEDERFQKIKRDLEDKIEYHNSRARRLETDQRNDDQAILSYLKRAGFETTSTSNQSAISQIFQCCDILLQDCRLLIKERDSLLQEKNSLLQECSSLTQRLQTCSLRLELAGEQTERLKSDLRLRTKEYEDRDAAMKGFDQKYEEAQQMHLAKMEEAAEGYEKKYDEAKQRYLTQMDDAARKYEKDTEILQADLQAFKFELGDQQAKHEADRKQQKERYASDLQQTRDKHTQDLKDLKVHYTRQQQIKDERHARQVEGILTKHDKEMEASQGAHNSEKQEMLDKHQNEISNMTETHITAEEALNAYIGDLEADLLTRSDDYRPATDQALKLKFGRLKQQVKDLTSPNNLALSSDPRVWSNCDRHGFLQRTNGNPPDRMRMQFLLSSLAWEILIDGFFSLPYGFGLLGQGKGQNALLTIQWSWLSLYDGDQSSSPTASERMTGANLLEICDRDYQANKFRSALFQSFSSFVAPKAGKGPRGPSTPTPGARDRDSYNSMLGRHYNDQRQKVENDLLGLLREVTANSLPEKARNTLAEITQLAGELALEIGLSRTQLRLSRKQHGDAGEYDLEFHHCQNADRDKGRLFTVNLLVAPGLSKLGDGRNEVMQPRVLSPAEIYPMETS